MSLPTTTTKPTSSAAAATTTTTTACKIYSARDTACECLVSLYVVALLAVLICATPAITRLLIFLQPNVSEFKVHSSSLSILNVSSTAIVADWNIILSVNNPNKKAIFYTHISALALKGTSLALSTVTILPIGLKGFNPVTIIEAKFSDMIISRLDEYHNHNASCGSLNLRMELQGLASYGGWTWPAKTDRIEVVCKDFKVDEDQFPLNISSLINFGSSSCDVDSQWKRIVAKCTKIFWNYIYVAVIVLVILGLSM